MTQDDNHTEASKPRAHGFLYGLIACLFLLQLAFAGWVYVTLSEQPAALATSADDSGLTELKDRLDAQEATLEALQETFEQALEVSSDAEVFGLQQETLADLNARLEALEKAEPQPIAGPVTAWQFEEMKKLSAELKSMQADLDAKGAAKWQQIQRMAAFDHLENQVFAHKPYAQALAAYGETLAADAKAPLASLKSLQYDGVPSWQSLHERFESARSAALEASDPSSKKNLLTSIGDNLSALVQVRKTGPQHTGNDLGSVLARAAFALEQQESEALLEEIAQLPASARGYFDELRESVIQREAVLAAMRELRTQLNAQLEAGE